MSFWNHFHHPRMGVTLLRVALALLMLLHGWSKITKGVGGIEGMLAQAGLPTVLAYGVYVGEVLAPLMLLVGLWVVPAALAIAVNMVFALALAHSKHWLVLSSSGGWALELQAFFLVTAVVVALTHPPKK